MAGLKLGDWASIAEIVASIVIVLSLIYLGFELNQNTRALQQSSYQSTMDRMLQSELALASQEQLANLYIGADSAPLEATPTEWFRYVRFVFPRFGEWEYLYLSRNVGALSELHWSAFDPYFREFACTPGAFRFWTENRLAWTPEFIEYIEQDVFPSCE